MVSNSVKISKLDTYNANHFKRVKGIVHPKIKDIVFPFCAIYPSREFWCKLCRVFWICSADVCLHLNMMEQYGTRWLEFLQMHCFDALSTISHVCLQKSWPTYSRKSTDLVGSSFMLELFSSYGISPSVSSQFTAQFLIIIINDNLITKTLQMSDPFIASLPK